MTQHDLLIEGAVEPELHSCYCRLSTHAIKIAMLLAALDTDIPLFHVELAHYARAQQIVERWRASLHNLRADTAARHNAGSHNPIAHLRERVLTLLDQVGSAGLSTRDIYRSLKLDKQLAERILIDLTGSSITEGFTLQGANSKIIQMWRRQSQREQQTGN